MEGKVFVKDVMFIWTEGQCVKCVCFKENMNIMSDMISFQL